jgi:4'-phosphopantetheinyl transferase
MLSLVYSDFSTLDTDKATIKLFQLHIPEFKGKENHLKDFLDPKETERANRFHFQKDKNTFIICRVILKFILAKYTNSSISRINIKTNSDKKPYLQGNSEVFFNLSHASDFAFLVVSTKAVGIDIEKIQKEFKYKEILSHILSPKELDKLLNSKNPRQNFYKIWTRKEAIVKATGKGIDNDFIHIPTQDGTNVVKPSWIGGIKRLEVKSFYFENGYIGALAFSSYGVNFSELSSYRIPPSIYN